MKMTFERGCFGENGKFGEQTLKFKPQNSNDKSKRPIESGDFDECAEFGENGKYGKNSSTLMPNKIAKGPPGKWRIWRNSPKMRLNFL